MILRPNATIQTLHTIREDILGNACRVAILTINGRKVLSLYYKSEKLETTQLDLIKGGEMFFIISNYK